MRAILTNFYPSSSATENQETPRPAPESQIRGRPPQGLEDLVAACVRDALGDASTAAQLLQDRIQSNRKALRELTQPLLADACLRAVSLRIKANRPPEDDWSNDEYEVADTSGRLLAMADSILDFRLPSGTLLRDAFAHDLEAASHWYLSRSKALKKRGDWLAAIAARVPRGRTAGDVWTGEQLHQLLESE